MCVYAQDHVVPEAENIRLHLIEWGLLLCVEKVEKKNHSLDKEVLTQWSLASIRSLSLQEGPTSGQSGN